MASSHLLHHLVFKPPPSSSSSSSSLLIKPLTSSLTLHLHKSLPTLFPPSPHSSFPPPRTRFFCNSSSSFSPTSSSLIYPQMPSPSLLLADDLNDEIQREEDEEEVEVEVEVEVEEKEESQTPIKALSVNNPAAKLPTLTIKEKKELTAYAHSLGKKLKIQLVGKSGVTDSVAAAFVENLESNELLKIKIHNSCPGELPDVIKQLEVMTGSVGVGQIGRSVILYRPSLTKLKAEEKKRQVQRLIARKGFRPKPTEFRVKSTEFRSKPDELMEKRRPAPRLSSRGRRGGNRYEDP